MRKIYIAGKVTGLPKLATAIKFKTVQFDLEYLGFEVVNPIELINNPNEDWDIAMEKCLEALELCDAIFMLPCYIDSKGAMIEYVKAVKRGIKVYHDLAMI